LDASGFLKYYHLSDKRCPYQTPDSSVFQNFGLI